MKKILAVLAVVAGCSGGVEPEDMTNNAGGGGAGGGARTETCEDIVNVSSDCLRGVCLNGVPVYVEIEDPEDDGNPCTKDVCQGVDTVHMPEPAGAMCESGLCDGLGNCI